MALHARRRHSTLGTMGQGEPELLLCAPFAIAVATTAPEVDHGVNILGNPQSVA